MADVHGLDTVASGNIMLLMAVALIVGNIVLGPLEVRLDTRKWLVVASAVLVLVSLLLPALIPRPPLALAAALFVLVSFCSAYNIVIAGHGRALFPDRLAGRGIAMLSVALMGGPAVLQSVTGLIMGAFPATDGTAPVDAYRAVFGFLAATVLVALVAYLRLPDARPSDGFATDPPLS